MLEVRGVGKSSLVFELTSSPFLTDDYSIEERYRKQVTIEDGWGDMASEAKGWGETFTGQYGAHMLMRTGEGFLCVYSIASRESFEAIPFFREQLLPSRTWTRCR